MENIHVDFLEEKPNVQGVGYRWMFDLDYLTDSMNYIPVSLENQANPNAGTSEDTNNAGTTNEENDSPENLIIPTTVRLSADANGTKQPSTQDKVPDSEAQAKETSPQDASEDS